VNRILESERKKAKNERSSHDGGVRQSFQKEVRTLLFRLLSATRSTMVTSRRSVFRPCIDLHQGVVKQIVGASLQDDDRAKERALASSSSSSSQTASIASLKTNFTSTLSSAHYAELYQKNNLTGAHVIKLGPRNDEAALAAIEAWRDGLQVGGGINASNAKYWVERGAEKVSV
jgi:phosphoribosylformimino-5-aminoimidazole carboxamide ribotide isomerase